MQSMVFALLVAFLAVGAGWLYPTDPLRIVGVLDTWSPQPLFYDLFVGRYDRQEDVFLPFSTSRDLEMSRSGSMNCWGDTSADATGGARVWQQSVLPQKNEA